MCTPETEPIPESAKTRFDAALNGTGSDPSGTEKTPAPRRGFRWRALAYLASAAACLALVVLVAIVYFKGRGKRIVPGESDPTPAPATVEPLPYTGVIYESESEAISAMSRFSYDNRALLETVMKDLRTPEYGYLAKGVVYPWHPESDKADFGSPLAETTEAIRTLVGLLGRDNYHWAYWDTKSYQSPVFRLSIAWANDDGYYSTTLIYSEDADLIINRIMPEVDGTTLEPVTESGAWGVYTSCWQKAPYFMSGDMGPSSRTPSPVTPEPTDDPFDAITPQPPDDPAATVAPTEEPVSAITPVPEPTPTPPPVSGS